MNFNEYDEAASITAIYTKDPSGLPIYPTLGLCGEAGEFAEKIKKALRDGTFDRNLALKELGDVLWYLSACARDLSSSLEEVAEINIEKLSSRAKKNTLQGSGDER